MNLFCLNDYKKSDLNTFIDYYFIAAYNSAKTQLYIFSKTISL